MLDDIKKALEEGQMVVVNGERYTKNGNPATNTKSMKDLPNEEDLVMGDADAEAKVVAKMKKEMEELKARLEKAEGSKKSSAKEASASKDEDKK